MNLTTVFAAVIGLSLTGTVAAGVILLLKRIFHNRLSAGWHYYIWLILLLRLLVPFAPESPLSIYALLNPMDKVSRSYDIGLPGMPVVAQQEPRTPEEQAPALPAVRPQVPLPSIRYLRDIWLFGVLAMACYMVFSNLYFYTAVSRKQRCRDADILDALSNCQAELGIKAGIDIAYSDKAASPCLFGLFKPVILLPHQTATKLTSQELRNVFLHELTHYQRKDILVHTLMLLALTLHWFNPVIWYAYYRIREDCEISCDAKVITRLQPHERLSYGKTILFMAKEFAGANRVFGTVGLAISRSSIKKRIVRLTNHKMTTFKTTATAVLLTLLVGCATLTQNPSEPVTPAGNAKLKVTSAFADIVTDYSISGGSGVTVDGSPDGPVNEESLIIPTVLHYQLTVKNVSDGLLTFGYGEIDFYLIPGEELGGIFPSFSRGGGWFPGELKPGEEGVFAVNIVLGADLPDYPEHIAHWPELPDKETQERILQLAHTAILTFVESESNEVILRSPIENIMP